MKPVLRLLVVDDEEEFLQAVSKRMTRRGHVARTAASSKAALEVLDEWLPDVVVLDVMLPDMDGIQCLRRIKERWPGLPVLLLTGHASMRAGLEGVSLGASDYCIKPVDFDVLLERVQIAHEESLRLGPPGPSP